MLNGSVPVLEKITKIFDWFILFERYFASRLQQSNEFVNLASNVAWQLETLKNV